jgi:glycine dehydrogenase
MSLCHPDQFVHRHIGPDDSSISGMLRTLGLKTLDELVEKTVPAQIRTQRTLNLPSARGEHELLGVLKNIASRNKVFRSCIGMGYYDCLTPPVIQRNILENPGWYTQYTPYQAEIARPSRIAPEFSNDGRGPHRLADCQCFAAR